MEGGTLETEKFDLIIVAGLIYEEYLYFTARHYNGLFRMKVGSEDVELVIMFDEKKVNFILYSKMYLYNEKLWLIPWQAEKIAIVDMQTHETEYIVPMYKQKNEIGQNDIGALFYSGVVYQEKYLFLCPCAVDTILVINMETREMTPYYGVVKPDEYFLFCVYDDAHDVVWMHPQVGSEMIMFCVDTGEIIRHKWKIPFNYVKGMQIKDRKIWFAPFEADSILTMDTDNLSYGCIPLGNEKKDGMYYPTWQDEGIFYTATANGAKILAVNMHNHSIKYFEIAEERAHGDESIETAMIDWNEKIMTVYHLGDGKSDLVYLDEQMNTKKIVPIQIERKKDRKGFFKILFQVVSNSMFIEEDNVGLNFFLHLVCGGNRKIENGEEIGYIFK